MTTDDEYREGYQKIKGRWWRSSDPLIPAPLRQELVNELMAARRAVASAKKTNCAEAMAAARFRVNNAKFALGERGHKWWLAADENAIRLRILMTLCAMLQHRPSGSVCPSEVARIATGSNWRGYMSTVRETAQQLTYPDFAEITQKGKSVQPPFTGPVRVRRGAKFQDLTGESLQTMVAEWKR